MTRIQLLNKARGIAAAAVAENRDFTDAERNEIESLMARARKLADDDSKLLGEIDNLGQSVAEAEGLNQVGMHGNRRSKSPLASLASAVVERIAQRGTYGEVRNAFTVSGDVSIPEDIVGAVITQPRAMSLVGQLVGAAQPMASGTMSVLRQSVRTSNAAPVGVGELKPTSLFEVERVEAPATTVAHLTEAVPRQFLEDADSLEPFIANELLLGILVALDDQIVNGTGVEPELQGILATTGVQAQAYDTSPLVTLRSALTMLQTSNVLDASSTDTSRVANALNPADWQAIELLTATSGEYLVGGPINAAERKLWGVDVVVANSVPVGQGILGRWSPETVALGNRGGVRLSWSEAVGDDFQRNHVRARCEGRWAFSVLQPAAFVVADLTAA